MSRYYSNTQKSRRERIGFYTALAICLVAVCMAVYSTYSTVTDVKKTSVVSRPINSMSLRYLSAFCQTSSLCAKYTSWENSPSTP